MLIRGANSGIYYAGKPHGGNWSGWQRLSGATIAAPSIVYANGAVHATVEGGHHGIYYNTRPVGGNWGNWQRLPGATITAPSIAATDMALHVVIQGSDNGIYYNCKPGWSGWTGWVRLSGATIAAPTAIGKGGYLYTAIKGSNTGIYYRTRAYNAQSNDQYFTHQWGLHNTGQYNGYVDADIDAPEAWCITQGSSNSMIAVIDTGVDYNHEDLHSSRIRTDIDYDFINNDDDAIDDHNHGTHVAGIAAANTYNHLGIAGVCPNCQILPIKVLDYGGSGTEETVSNGIRHAADRRADVINMSLGAEGCSNLIADAVNYAYDRGTLIIAAAGNSGDGDCTFSTALLGGSGNICHPANLSRVIAIGASNNRDQKAGFSSYGPELDVMAPGEKIESTVCNNQYEFYNGTSMASPFAAGTAGLILSLRPTLANESLRHLLRNTADDICGSGRDDYCGWGRINARRALDTTPSSVPNLPPDSCAGRQSTGLAGLQVLYYARQVRDELFMNSAKGREYTELYYQYSPEISVMLIQDDELRGQVADFLIKYLPAFQSLLPDSGQQVQVTAEMIDDMTRLKNVIYQKASLELGEDLNRVWTEVALEKRKGETVAQVWQHLTRDHTAGGEMEHETSWVAADEMFVPGEIIVKFTAEVARASTWQAGQATTGIASIDALNRKYNVRAMELVFPEAAEDASLAAQYGLTRVFKLAVAEDTDLFTMLEEYNTDPSIEYAELNMVIRVDGTMRARAPRQPHYMCYSNPH
jgi:hypothetical protein